MDVVRRGTIEFALRRVDAIGATNDFLGTHLGQPAETKYKQVSGLLLCRADMQTIWQTERDRFLQLGRNPGNVMAVPAAKGAVLQV